ncbi:MerR family transcriptional regulator [Aestuariivita boseongensis]|uniref:MerR family transcriptional regulator n=1 Tax=Aestuariivita boseongensis TaxID=1470562 RepID=UPI0009E4DEBB|nr:MerR family transcriptional regulator [Aestuariivita boseongensis]
MDKSPDAFRTISEVAEWLGVQTHVLRFWESKFSQVKPVKRAGGRRYYRPSDMQLLGGIKKLLHDDGMTIKGVQKLLREEGVAHVAGFSQDLDGTAETAAEQEVGENVVRFNARPEEAATAEPAITAPPAPATTPEPEAPSPLPAFLTQPMGGATEAQAKKPDIVDAPDPPADDQITAAAGALSHLAGLNAVDSDAARALAPLIGRLAVLRDRMAEAGA